jgi:SAM-dependent methyltransferase
MLNYYAARANEYDNVYRKAERQTDLRAIEHWVSQRFAGASVLEIACGTGYWTQFIAKSATRVCAFDAAPETLAIAKTRAPMANVEFLVADAYDPPRVAAALDAAFAGFWFSHVPKARQCEFLKVVHASLGDGARVVFLDNRFIEGSSTPIAEQDQDGNTYQIRRLRDGTTHRVLKNFPSESELHSLAAAVGRDVRYIQWDYYWALSYVADQG